MKDIIRPVPPSRISGENNLKGRLAWFVMIYLLGLGAILVFSYGFRFLLME